MKKANIIDVLEIIDNLDRHTQRFFYEFCVASRRDAHTEYQYGSRTDQMIGALLHNMADEFDDFVVIKHLPVRTTMSGDDVRIVFLSGFHEVTKAILTLRNL